MSDTDELYDALCGAIQQVKEAFSNEEWGRWADSFMSGEDRRPVSSASAASCAAAFELQTEREDQRAPAFAAFAVAHAAALLVVLRKDAAPVVSWAVTFVAQKIGRESEG